jgi:hypothetical protein
MWCLLGVKLLMATPLDSCAVAGVPGCTAVTVVRVAHRRDSCMHTKVIVVLTVDASSCAMLLFVSTGTGNGQGPSG